MVVQPTPAVARHFCAATYQKSPFCATLSHVKVASRGDTSTVKLLFKQRVESADVYS